MRRIFALLIMVSFLFAKVDYSQMSNEELIALIGYVSPKNQKEFDDEIQKRKKTFSKDELEKYEQIKLKQLKKHDENTTS